MEKLKRRPSNIIEEESQFGGKQVTLKNSKHQISGEDDDFRTWASFNQFGMEHHMLKAMIVSEREKYINSTVEEQSKYFYWWLRKKYEKIRQIQK